MTSIKQRVVATALVEYPALVRAIKDLAYDNGAINRLITEQEVVEHTLYGLCSNFTCAQLVEVEAELAKLDTPHLYALCCGLDDDRPTVSDLCDAVLESAFEQL